MSSFDSSEIYKTLYTSPLINIVVFSPKNILDANETFCKITGYSKKELSKLKLSDIASEEHREKVKVLENKLSKKEKFVCLETIKLIKKDKSSLWFHGYFQSLSYKNQNLGLFLGEDVTFQKKQEILFHTLKDVNQLILEVSFENELFEKICSLLHKNLNLKLVWIGIPDKESHTIKPVYIYGENGEYLKIIKISLDETLPEGKGPTAQAFRSGEIIINPDSRVNPQFLPWKDEALKRGYLSSCAIPLRKRDKVVAVLNLYSSEPNFFDEALEPLLKEIQRNLSFALEKIEQIRSGLLTVTALSKAKDWVFITDEKGYILNVNDVVCEETGYSRDEFIGKHASFLDDPEALAKLMDELEKTVLKRREEYINLFIKTTKDGRKIILKQKIIPVELPGNIVNYVALGTDVTKELKLLVELERIKTLDLLTGLFNLEAFSAKVDEILKISETKGLLILMDIWGMSYINKNYGLEVGNKLLKKIASLLKETFKENAILGRTAGDEFGIFIYNLEDSETFEIVKLIKIFEKPFEINDHSLKMEINLGCSLFPSDGNNFKILYEKASIALNEAKNKGPGNIVFYNKELETKLNYLLNAERLITKAFKEDLFIFHYQPYFWTSNLELAGFEALVRIKEDERIYYPGEFIEYLESHSEYLFEFEERGLKKILKQIESWKKPISFNLSAKSLENTLFIHELTDINSEIAKNLVIEITERELIKGINTAVVNLNYIKSKNPYIKIAIDDFGTGHASFSYLKDLPVDFVKIDLSFIRDLTKGEKEINLVKGIINLCHSLGFKTIAEGVETEEQYQILKDLGCDKVQGFYFSKPLSPEKAELLLRD